MPVSRSFLLLLCCMPAVLLAAPAPLTEPGVLLTFDDTDVEGWVAAQPVFEKHGAHATFFISRFDSLRPKQIEGLHLLQKKGHAIACHGWRHRKAVEYVEKEGLDAYLKEEIAPAVKAMKEAGFAPTAFAYPCSQNNAETDAALQPWFRHLRSGTAPKQGQSLDQLDAIFTPLNAVASRYCLDGRGIDRIGKPGNEARFAGLCAALDRAKRKQEIVVFYAHCIRENSKSHHIAPATLDALLREIDKRGLRTYTYDDLP